MMNTTPDKPYEHPSVWNSTQMHNSDEWVLHLDKRDNDELQAALLAVRNSGKEFTEVTKADFPLPRLSERLKKMQQDLTQGRGFSLVRGFDINRYELRDAAQIYWGIGAHIGKHGAQNAQGDLLGHVTDLGVDYKANAAARGYQTKSRLPFHNDALDVVSLMCVRPAKSGGLSRIVSSTAVHNEVMARRPDLLSVLYQDYYLDRRGEAPEGLKPYHATPFFSWAGGRLFCQYNRTYAMSAQRFEDVPRFTQAQLEALDLMDQITNDPKLVLEMDFGPGDMQFVSNYTVLHSRTDYEDWPEKERRRYLLRLWLDTGLVTPLPAGIAERWGDVKLWQATPQPAIFDLSPVHTELIH